MKIDFNCTKCGNCCKLDGYVELEKGEPERIAAYLGINIKSLCKFGIGAVEELGKYAIIINDGKGCPFLKNNLCSIQDVKPKQCSDFPYWPEVYTSLEVREDIQTFCPGFKVLNE
mgnify:CR=1 FL=1